MKYRSLVRQTLHYFSRPHQRLPREPVRSPAGWRTSDFDDESSWRSALSRKHVEEIEQALEHARATGKPTGELAAGDFPLPTLTRLVDHWRDVLAHGRGFVVVGGVPVERWSEADAERFFWCLGLHLGIPGAQNPEGDLLGHVRDQRLGVDDVTVRAYRTRQDIAFHCDAADVVGLLCLKRAASGGKSRIASSVTIFNELFASDPELALELFRPLYFDTKAEGGLRYFPVPPCRFADGELRTFYHSDYFREVSRYPEVGELSATTKRLLDRYDEIANDPDVCLEMDLAPGDIQLLSNHTVVHARRAYEDHPEPEQRRHLLRLWLSLRQEPRLGQRLRRASSLVGLLTNLAAQRVRQASA